MATALPCGVGHWCRACSPRRVADPALVGLGGQGDGGEAAVFLYAGSAQAQPGQTGIGGKLGVGREGTRGCGRASPHSWVSCAWARVLRGVSRASGWRLSRAWCQACAAPAVSSQPRRRWLIPRPAWAAVSRAPKGWGAPRLAVGWLLRSTVWTPAKMATWVPGCAPRARLTPACRPLVSRSSGECSPSPRRQALVPQVCTQALPLAVWARADSRTKRLSSSRAPRQAPSARFNPWRLYCSCNQT
ncbi:hypothetical protein CDEF62S_01927 [Castellaniella defragrans]